MNKSKFILSVREQIIFGLAEAFPKLIVVTMLIGFLLAFLMNRFDFAIRGVIIAIPSFLSALILLKISQKKIVIDNMISLFPFNQRRLLVLFIIFYVCSISILLHSSIRTSHYFVVALIIYVIIFIQIFSKKVNSNMILLEIIFMMANLIYGVTLKYPLYFGGTDLLTHMFLSKVVFLSGHIIPEDLYISYFYFPLYHIFISESAYLLNLDIQKSLFISTVPIYIFLIVFIYYTFRNFVIEKRIILLTCLLFSVTYIIMYSGFAMITRTMAFAGYIILLYCIFKKKVTKNSTAYVVISFIIVLFILLVHQVSLLIIIALLFILYVSEYAINSSKHISKNHLLLINVLLLSYWFYVAYLFTQQIIEQRKHSIYYEEIIIQSTIKSTNQWIYCLDHIDTSVFIFFSLIGIGYTLWNKKRNYFQVFSLFSLLSLILYVPNPIHMVWQAMDLFEFDRFMLFVVPFMALVMSSGIIIFHEFLSKQNMKKLSFLIIILLFSTFVLTSLLSSGPISHNPLHESTKKYFSNDELLGFDYVFSHVPFGSNLYSDYYTSRYFVQKEFNDSISLGLPFYNSHVIKNVEDISTYNDFIIIRVHDFDDVGLNFNVAPSYLYESTDENTIKLYSEMEKTNKIYSSHSVDIFYNI